ncbi:MAG: hypothetical protein JWL65_6855 [Gammaproteobacteria bacterium]|nr:hypothetical protein [Gammaproteobacteria bacterium]
MHSAGTNQRTYTYDANDNMSTTYSIFLCRVHEVDYAIQSAEPAISGLRRRGRNGRVGNKCKSESLTVLCSEVIQHPTVDEAHVFRQFREGISIGDLHSCCVTIQGGRCFTIVSILLEIDIMSNQFVNIEIHRS